MKRSTRLLLALALIEAILATIWFWLVSGIKTGAMTTVGDPAQAVAAISSTMGAVMGGTAAIALLAVVLMSRKGI